MKEIQDGMGMISNKLDFPEIEKCIYRYRTGYKILNGEVILPGGTITTIKTNLWDHVGYPHFLDKVIEAMNVLADGWHIERGKNTVKVMLAKGPGRPFELCKKGAMSGDLGSQGFYYPVCPER